MKTAVVIATYKGKTRGHLEAALASVLAQTLVPDEIVVVDDGSPDGSADFIRARFPGVTLIEQVNAGTAAARNTGLRHTQADLVSLLDDDDEWPVAKHQHQVEAMCAPENRDVVLVFGNVDLIDAQGKVTGFHRVFRSGINWPELLFANHIFGTSGVMMRGAILREVGFFDISISGVDDYDMWLRLARRGQTLALDETVLRYRSHGSNQSNSLTHMHAKTLEVMARYEDQVEPGYYRQAVSYYCHGGFFRALLRGNPAEAARMLRRPGVKWYRLDMLALRAVGMGLAALGEQRAKILFRDLEYSLYVTRTPHAGARARHGQSPRAPEPHSPR